jgi:tripartite ATP-independent transporter DctP family solute receptor
MRKADDMANTITAIMGNRKDIGDRMVTISRRAFVAGAAAFPFIAPARAAEPLIKAKQYHNQPTDSHQHQFLVDLWAAVKKETDGKVDVTVSPQNAGVAGGDPAVLDMLVKGEVEFFTLNGGLVARVVPVMDIQGLPFAYSTSEQVHKSNDGALGAYLSKECAAKGIHRFQYGLLENGFKQISTVDKPVNKAEDLAGQRIRVPASKMFEDMYVTLDAKPVVLNFNQMVQAFKDKKIDGQENPLAITEVNKLYEVTKYIAVTNHSWAGFNLISNLPFWEKVPADIKTVIDRNVKKYVALQRKAAQDLNDSLEPKLKERGMIFTRADTDSFRKKLAGGFYPRWKEDLGATAWDLLEKDVGKLG